MLLGRHRGAIRALSASASSLRIPNKDLPKTLTEFKSAFPLHVRKEVEFRDLDSYNHVNNATFFSYFEIARTQLWRAKSDGTWDIAAKGIAPVLQDTWCHFRIPITLYDVVHIGLLVQQQDLERASFEHRYCIFSEDHGQVAAQGGSTIVLCDFDNGGRRAKSIPQNSMDRWL